MEADLQRGVGYLGVDFSLENGAYRIKKIIDDAPWDAEVRSPLRSPGIEVKEGDYLLAVNGLPLDIAQEPYAAFQGLADKPVFLTVNDKPSLTGSRQVLVQTLSSEARLRHLAWIEKNRQRVRGHGRKSRLCLCPRYRAAWPVRISSPVPGAIRQSRHDY